MYKLFIVCGLVILASWTIFPLRGGGIGGTTGGVLLFVLGLVILLLFLPRRRTRWNQSMAIDLGRTSAGKR